MKASCGWYLLVAMRNLAESALKAKSAAADAWTREGQFFGPEGHVLGLL